MLIDFGSDAVLKPAGPCSFPAVRRSTHSQNDFCLTVHHGLQQCAIIWGVAGLLGWLVIFLCGSRRPSQLGGLSVESKQHCCFCWQILVTLRAIIRVKQIRFAVRAVWPQLPGRRMRSSELVIRQYSLITPVDSVIILCGFALRVGVHRASTRCYHEFRR